MSGGGGGVGGIELDNATQNVVGNGNGVNMSRHYSSSSVSLASCSSSSSFSGQQQQQHQHQQPQAQQDVRGNVIDGGVNNGTGADATPSSRASTPAFLDEESATEDVISSPRTQPPSPQQHGHGHGAPKAGSGEFGVVSVEGAGKVNGKERGVKVTDVDESGDEDEGEEEDEEAGIVFGDVTPRGPSPIPLPSRGGEQKTAVPVPGRRGSYQAYDPLTAAT
ncbi:hypothetical protein HK102_011081, partial [Quaeritorhiza haematococci]